MRRGVKALGVVAVAGLAAAAQAHGGPMGMPPGGGMFPGGGPVAGGPHGGPAGGPAGGPRAPDERMVAMLLARTADADRSGDVTAAEWSAFLASLNADATTGAVDMTALAAALPPAPPNAPADGLTRILDKDGDGVVTLADLNAFFALLDADGDGALSQAELAPPAAGHGPGGDHGGLGGAPGGHGGQGGGGPQGPAPQARAVAAMLAHAADADRSGDVTSDEWTAFLASLNADATTGDVDMTALVSALEGARPAKTKSRALKKALKRVKKAVKSGQDPSALLVQLLVQLLDHDGDGAVQVTDLQWFFDLLDADADGALSQAELAPPPMLHGGDAHAAGALLHAADADASGDVTAAEWTAFEDGLAVDANGAVSLDDLAARIGAPTPPSGDTTERDEHLTHAFDRDGDGTVTKADLQAIFDMADGNADGTLDQTELRPKR